MDTVPSPDLAVPEARLLRRRRLIFAALVTASAAALIVLMALSLAVAGFGVLDLVMLVCFALTVPWTVIGFWNAAIGLMLCFRRDPVAAVAPFAASGDDAAPLSSRVALLACTRNEEPVALGRRLAAMVDDLMSTGMPGHFHLFILSDTSFPDIADAEQAMAEELRHSFAGRIPLTYRRRTENLGFKAGNVRDFCRRWGAGFDYAVILDADSLMAASAVLRALRIMERNPRLGILQTLVTGMPSASAFARIFQFGMRLGMRSYTLGSAWWQGDCGPYWGHNAVLRLKPFIADCELPVLKGRPPLGGYVLSHDQVEAALMRRAGYEVRVLPIEDASFEQNPPEVIEFIRRDLRWCQGNMQYWRLLKLPRLKTMSRIQLALAIQMYLGPPAWMAFLALGVARSLISALPPIRFDGTIGPLVLAAILVMTFAPKFATAIDVVLRPGLRRAFGGTFAFSVNLVTEILFTALLAPIVAVAQTRFVLGLVFGRAVPWTVQRRDDHALPLKDAVRRLWPQTLFGAALCAAAWDGGYFASMLPVAIGPLVAIPFAMISASPAVGRLLTRIGAGRIPEETQPLAILRRIGLPALEPRVRATKVLAPVA